MPQDLEQIVYASGVLGDRIDTADSAFCRRHNIRTTYERYWTGAQEQ